ncbi:MAG: SDR family NAD(P)-dependent oxidoreductase [Planctomycetota bacterium]
MKRRTSSSPLAIVGISCLFPKADGLEKYWANIKNRVDAITEIPATHWRPDDYFDDDPKSPDRTYARRGGFIDPVAFNPLEYGIAPKDIEATDTSQLLALVAAQRALDDAGYGKSGRAFDRQRTSVIIGVTGTLELVIPLGARLGHPIWRRALAEAGVEPETAEQVVKGISDSYVGWQENSFPGLLGNVVAGRIASRLDLGGTNCVVDAACASSLSALHLAALELDAGRSDMVITGGVDTFNDIFMYMCFSKTPALSRSGNAKPFDRNADGTIIGEGLGLLVLKRLEDAERDEDRIYAVVRGIGSSSDGRGNAIYAPSAPGQAKALRNAYRQADVAPDSIELIEAHGTGTVVGDSIEVTALNEVFRERRAEGTWCALGSVKSQIGHTKAAAGAAGLIKAALALHHKVLPPTIKVERPNEKVLPGTTPFYVNAEARPWVARPQHPRRAGVSSFGFGGSNFHCVLEEYGSSKPGVDWDGRVQILALSAATEEELRSKLASVRSEPSWPEFAALAASSREQFSAADRCRLLMVVTEHDPDVGKRVASALHMLGQRGADRAWQTPDGVYYGCGVPDGSLALLFPGQGAQYPGMLRDLACQFPEFQAVLDAANAAFWHDDTSGECLTDRIYPPHAFDDAERAAQAVALRDTRVAQPAIGAVSLGAWRVLESFGVKVSATGGHSYGELPALFVAGRITESALHSLSNFRGRMMSEGSGERGAMLAVEAPLHLLERLLSDEGLDLVIANRNAPRQAVLSGRSAQIDRAREALTRLQIRHTPLPVAAAFHSPLVADARRPFGRVLQKVRFRPATLPVYANTTGAVYPEGEREARELLAGQLAEPVEFVRQIESMVAAGVRRFLEVGPGSRLTALVGAILGDRVHTAIALDASGGRRAATAGRPALTPGAAVPASGIEDLARCLAQLAALGEPVTLTAWQAGHAPPVRETSTRPVLTVPISGANHVDPRSRPEPPRPPRGSAVVSPRVGSSSPADAPATFPAPAVGAAQTVGERDRMARSESGSTMAARTTASGAANELGGLRRAGLEPAVGTASSASIAPAPEPTLASGVRRATLAQAPMDAQLLARSEALIAPSSSSSGDRSAMPRPTSPGLLGAAFQVTQESLVALQRMQEQTARLHQQFLEGQALALSTFHELVLQQQRLFGAESTSAAAPAPSLQPSRAAEVATRASEHPVPRATVAAAPSVAPPPRPALVPRTTADASAERPPVQFASPEVARALLHVVAEKTGYPEEMLNLDMELDADLGIDSIKRVEILSALQDRLPGAPAIAADRMGALRTLREVASALTAEPTGARATLATASATTGPALSDAGLASPQRQVADDVAHTLLRVVAEKTGYPEEMLNLDMELDADLGIDSIKRVEILSALQDRLPGSPAIAADRMGALRTLREVASALTAEPTGARATLATASATTGPALSDAGLASPQRQVADDVAHTLLRVVAEKTGYPEEMLNLDMELDADLGIDSIKRVEILSALQDRLPGSPAIAADRMGTLRTLREVAAVLGVVEVQIPVQHLAEAVELTRPRAAEAGPMQSATSGTNTPDGATNALLAVVAEKTGYPVEMLHLDMHLDSDLGIDSIKRVEIFAALQERLPEAPVAQPEHLGRLGTLREIVGFLVGPVKAESTSASPPRPVKTTPDTKRNESIPANGEHGSMSAAAVPAAASPRLERIVVTAVGLGRVAARRALEIPRESTFWITDAADGLARRVAARFEELGHHARIVQVSDADLVPPTRLAGLIVLTPREPVAVEFLRDALFLVQRAGSSLRAAGGVAASTLVTVSRVDGSFGFASADPVHDPRSGGLAGLAKTVAREWPEVSAKALDVATELDDLDVVARAIVEEALISGPDEVGLTRAGRVQLQAVEATIDPADGSDVPIEPGDVIVVTGGARGVTAECALALARHASPTLVLLGRSPHPTPEPEWLASLATDGAIKRALLEQLPLAERNPRGVQQAWERITGARAMRSAMARMTDAGSRVIYMPVDVADPAALRAALQEVERSVGPIRGFVHGAGVLADQRIDDKTQAAFDRVFATKVGGAEALLAAVDPAALRFAVFFSSSTARYGRVGQVDYAMANEVLNKLAQRWARLHPTCRVLSLNWGPWDGGMVGPELARVFAREGVGLIPLEVGARHLLAELGCVADRPVEVVLIGPTPQPASKGLAASAASTPLRMAPSALPLVFEREVDVARFPALQDHRLDGRPVLPVALMVEWLAHGALHSNPGLVLHGMDELRVLKGVAFESADGVRLRVHAAPAERSGDCFTVVVELRGGRAPSEDMLHARATVLLTATPQRAGVDDALTAPSATHGAPAWGDIYERLLFHGPHFHALAEIEGCSPDGIIAVARAAPPPREWSSEPLRPRWIADPLLLDAAFQMMILWCLDQRGHGSLPCAFREYRQYVKSFPTRVKIVARVTRSGEHAALADMDFVGADGTRLASLRGYECVIDPSLRAAFQEDRMP